MTGPAQIEWLDRVRDELESYRSALAWLIEHSSSCGNGCRRVGADVVLADARAFVRGASVV